MPPGRSAGSGWRGDLARRLREKDARVGVVGLGYVGLPLLVAAVRAGFRGSGVDLDQGRIDAIGRGRSYVSDVPDTVLREVGAQLRVSRTSTSLRDCDVVLICVPTPLKDHDPYLRHIELAGEGIAKNLRAGTLVVLESTTYPGTTEEVLRPILERSGLVAGRDFGLAYSPERIDPGRGSNTSPRRRRWSEGSRVATANWPRPSIAHSSTRSKSSPPLARPRWPS